MNLKVTSNILLLFCIINTLFGQQPDWVIEPVIENVDEVDARPCKYGLIKINKDGLEGMVNADNTLIVPPIYRSVSVEINGKVINAIKKDRSGNDFYSITGSSVSEEQYKSMSKEYWDSKDKNTGPSETFQAILNTDPKVKFEQTTKGNYDIFSPSGELVAINARVSQSKLIGKNFIRVRDRSTEKKQRDAKNIIVLNLKTGEILERNTQRPEIEINPQGYFSIEGDDDTKLYNKHGDYLKKFEEFTFCKNEHLGIGISDGKYRLYDLEVMKQIGEVTNNIYDNNSHIIFRFDQKTVIYNTGSKSFSEFPYQYNNYQNLDNTDTNQLVLKDREMLGVFDITVESWIIEPEFAYIVNTTFNYYIARRDNYIGFKTHMTLIDLEGNIIYDDPNLGIYCFVNSYKVTNPDFSTKLMSYSGTELESFSSEYVVSSYRDRNMFSVTKLKGGSSESYHVNKYFSDEVVRFDHVEFTIVSKAEPNTFWYIIKKGNLLGILDFEGNVILPILYDKIIIDRFENDYIKVRKDNKWGVLVHP